MMMVETSGEGDSVLSLALERVNLDGDFPRLVLLRMEPLTEPGGWTPNFATAPEQEGPVLQNCLLM